MQIEVWRNRNYVLVIQYSKLIDVKLYVKLQMINKYKVKIVFGKIYLWILYDYNDFYKEYQ